MVLANMKKNLKTLSETAILVALNLYGIYTIRVSNNIVNRDFFTFEITLFHYLKLGKVKECNKERCVN